MIDLVFQNSDRDKSFKRDFFENVINAGIDEIGLEEKNIEISINLTGEKIIRGLNKKYRNKDKVTDVLSFPVDDKPLPESEIILLGDIFICLPFAKKEAKSENVNIQFKLAQLAVHGFLHLAGYDHELSASEARKMFDLESRILKKLKLD